MLRHVAAFSLVSVTTLIVGGLPPAVALVLILFTMLLVVLFTKVVFTHAKEVGARMLIATWLLVLGCVVLNFAALYSDDSYAEPAAFTTPLSDTQALELSLSTLAPGVVADATPRTGLASLEHTLEAVFALAALGLPAGGMVGALQQKTST
jgi:hypothetical protein